MTKRIALAGITLAGVITTGLTATTAQADTSHAVRGTASANGIACGTGVACGYDSGGNLLWVDGQCDPLHIFNFGAAGYSDRTYVIYNYVPNSALQAYNYGGSAGWLPVGPYLNYTGVHIYATGSPQGIDGVRLSC